MLTLRGEHFYLHALTRTLYTWSMLRPRPSRIPALVRPRGAVAQVIYWNGRGNPSYPLATLKAGHLDRPGSPDDGWTARPAASRGDGIERFLDNLADREVKKEFGNRKMTWQADPTAPTNPRLAGLVTLCFAESN